MFTKTNLISTVVTFLWAFFGGYLLWGILGESLFADHIIADESIMKEQPLFMFLALGCLIFGFAFSTIYRNWNLGPKSIASGVKFGLWIGILFGFGEGFIDYSTGNIMDLTGTIINAILYLVFFVIMGGIAGLIYSKAS